MLVAFDRVAARVLTIISSPNTSPCTRVSLDFRVGVGGYFDPNWTLREAKAQHTRRHVVL